jgi:hypothetical protein
MVTCATLNGTSSDREHQLNDPQGLLTFQVLGDGGSTQDQRGAFTRQIQERLRAIPGIQGVTASYPFPLAGGFHPIRWGTGEALADASKFQAADDQIVLPGYFEVMRTPLLAGRTFTMRITHPAATRYSLTSCWRIRPSLTNRRSASAFSSEPAPRSPNGSR